MTFDLQAPKTIGYHTSLSVGPYIYEVRTQMGDPNLSYRPETKFTQPPPVTLTFDLHAPKTIGFLLECWAIHI